MAGSWARLKQEDLAISNAPLYILRRSEELLRLTCQGMDPAGLTVSERDTA